MNQLIRRMTEAGTEEPGDKSPPLRSITGAMTDACKRGRSSGEIEVPDPDVLSEAAWDHVEASLTTPAGVKLPPGVTDMMDWGSTLCQMPKVAHLEMS